MAEIDYSKCSCGADKEYSTQGCKQCWHCSDENCYNDGCDATAITWGWRPVGFDVDEPLPRTRNPLPIASLKYNNKPETTWGIPPDNHYMQCGNVEPTPWNITTTNLPGCETLWYDAAALKCKIYRINKNNPLPTQSNPEDAGWDVYASETVRFELGETKLVPLGIIAQTPKGYHFKLCIRSSIPYKRGFCLANSVGIIDSSYCGPKDEIKMMLRAPYSGSPYDHREHVIQEGDRIGQLILEKNNDIEWDEQDSADFAKTSRGGFGSSDGG